MKKKYATRRSTPIYVWTFILCSFLFVSGLHAQPLDIAGTYTIDPAGGAFDPGVNNNFLSFNDAIDTLINRGISGEVTINVADGLYDEAFTISAIPGSGPTNTVTFQSASTDSSKVYLNFSGYNADTTSIVTVNGASYITIRHLGFDLTLGSSSYGRGILLNGNCYNITVENNNFIGKTSSSSYSDNWPAIFGWGDIGNNLEFRNNRFSLGENGIKLSGDDTPPTGIVIENNVFIDQLETSAYLRDLDAPVFRNNDITTTNYTYKTGIHFIEVVKGFEISGNRISMNDYNSAIQIQNCVSNPGDEGMVFNNFIANRGTAGASNYGIWLDGASYTNVYHNSIYQAEGWKTNSRTLYQSGGGNNLKIMNNSFQNSSGGYACYITNGTSVLTSNNNNYYTNGNFLARWESSDLTTLEGLRTAGSQDAASVSANPWHTSTTDLHTTSFWLEGMGADLTAAVAVDIDGDTRSATPDIGADEFTGTGAALSGDYYIGGASPDYPTLQAAAADLSRYGVSGPVNLLIRDTDSPYSGLVTLEPVAGTSPTNTITIGPDPANTGDVILVNDGTETNNQTLNIFRGNNIVIRDLTLAAANDRYSTIIRLRGYAANITVTGCSLNSLGTYSGNAAILGPDVTINTITIDDNVFTGGTRGVEINGMDNISFKPKKVTITNNTFSDHYYGGVYLDDCIAPVITGNMTQAGTSSYNTWGIYLSDCNDNFKIHNNKVLINSDDGGIGVSNCSGSSVFTGSLINNYVELYSGGDAVNGIDIYYSNYVNVYFNTSRIFEGNNNTNSNAFYVNGGSSIRVKNNNFVNFGGGRAYYTSTATAILESDHNNLFSTGFLGYWNGDNYSSLDNWQVATEKDIQSVSNNPWFLVQGEPDINSSFLDNMGTPLSGIVTDINGETRQDPPDIGAFEYTSTQTPLTSRAYTVGGETHDYATLTAAFADMQNRGISGPVTFNIRSGEYNEIVPKLLKISGAGPDNRITVQSETGNPEDVQFYYMTTSSENSSNIISLAGVSYFTLKDITISAQGTQYGRPISLSNNVDNIEIVNNILTSANTGYAVLDITGICQNTTIRNNIISGGSGGVFLNGDYYNYGSGN
ncbi:MAG: right-handed parallel beta-helix repeat-containing protein, partial [Bacteroidales bacterium]|nr:right-handed parallel beta-helix repeat-containing protein [Bacteroidales bacterium]